MAFNPQMISQLAGIASALGNLGKEKKGSNSSGAATTAASGVDSGGTEGPKGAGFAQIASMVAPMGSAIGNALGGDKYEKTSLTQTGDQIFDAASDVVMQFNPLVGGIMKAGGFLSDAVLGPLGGTKANGSKMDQIASSKLLSLTPIAMINSFTAKKIDNQVKLNKDIARSSSYTGTASEMNTGVENSQRYYGGIFGKKARGKAENQAIEANRQIRLTSGILDESKLQKRRLDSSSDMFTQRYNQQRSGGVGDITFGREGLKFIQDFRKVYKEKQISVTKFKNGGTFDKNIIPQGKLHKELHHLDNEEITRKGIPVILREGDKLTQVAEIEVGEIIFNKSVTDRLEELYKEGTDEAAIEAGKILCKEILHNTIDKGKLIKSIE